MNKKKTVEPFQDINTPSIMEIQWNLEEEISKIPMNANVVETMDAFRSIVYENEWVRHIYNTKDKESWEYKEMNRVLAELKSQAFQEDGRGISKRDLGYAIVKDTSGRTQETGRSNTAERNLDYYNNRRDREAQYTGRYAKFYDSDND